MISKCALVFGASGDIGFAICEQLANSGWDIIMHYSKTKPSLEALQQNYPNQLFTCVQADFLNESEIENLLEQLPSLNAVVFSHGISLEKMLDDTTTVEMTHLWKIHVETPMFLCGKILPKLRERDGNVLFVSSLWGNVGAAFETVYSAVKGAQISFAKALAKEWASFPIRVNTVSPGWIATKMNEHYEMEEIEHAIKEIPVQRLGSPKQVATVVKYLISDDASYITGQNIRIDGGWYMS